MSLRFARPAVALLALTLAGPPLALAQEKAGIVATIQGTATAARVHLPEPVALKFKDDVFQNDRIVTGDRSLVRVLLGGKAVVTVRERSALTITETPGRSTINLGIGKIAVAVAKDRMRPGESLEVRTPNAVAAIRGTVFVVEVMRATAQAGTTTSGGVTTTIYGFSGSVLVDFSGHVVNLPANQVASGTGQEPPTLQVMTGDDRSNALSGLTTNPQYVDGGQDGAKDQAMGSTVATFGANPPDPPAPPPTFDTSCSGANCPEDAPILPDTGGGDPEPPAATTLTSPLCCPQNTDLGPITFNGTSAGTPLFLMSGGSLTVGTETDAVNLFELQGAAVDPQTGLGTERPLEPGSESPVFQSEGGATITVHGRAFRVDTALLEATGPLLKLTAGTAFNARGPVVDLTAHAKVSIPNDAVAMISLNASTMNVSGHLVNVAGRSRLDVAGSLVSLSGSSTLNILDGTILSVSGRSLATIGTLVSFSGTGNVLNVTNSFVPTAWLGENIPVSVSGPAKSVQITGAPLKGLGTSGTITINGVTLTSNTPLTSLTGSLIKIGP